MGAQNHLQILTKKVTPHLSKLEGEKTEEGNQKCTIYINKEGQYDRYIVR